MKILDQINISLHKKKNDRFFKFLSLAFFILFSGACGITAKTKAITKALIKGNLKMYVNIAPDLNSDNPLPVDIVWVYDEDLLKKLLKISAKTWFEKKDQFKKDFPSNKAFEVWPWEWTPGQKITVKKIPIKAKSKGGIIFANYKKDGDHRARVDPAEDFQIDFSKESFVVKETKD